jgi:hypothetical protein
MKPKPEIVTYHTNQSNLNIDVECLEPKFNQVVPKTAKNISKAIV